MKFNKEELSIMNSALIYYGMSLNGDQRTEVTKLINKTSDNEEKEYKEITGLLKEYSKGGDENE